VCNALCTKRKRIARVKCSFKQSFNTLMYYLNLTTTKEMEEKKGKEKHCISVGCLEASIAF
jgi:hypothetical protein